MSHNIAIELQEEIMKWLPVKSLIQYRSVSKAWKSLIDSSDFITDHSLRHTPPEHLLIRYKHRYTNTINYISFVDDHTFPQQKFVPILPPLPNELNLSMVGSSHGLFCLYGFYKEPDHSPCYKAILWNPSIRKSITIFMPNELYWPNNTVIGFGVCAVKRDPKMVRIVWQKIKKGSKPWIVQVYTLSTGKWKSLSSNLPQNSIEVTCFHVAIDRFIYWLAYDMVSKDDGFRSHNLILSFDMVDESFGVIDLPDSLLFRHLIQMITVSKLRESLAVLEHRRDNMKQVCDVWLMDHGIQKSFTKLFTINAPHTSIKTTLGFRKSGEPIIETKDHHQDPDGPTALGVYEPNSERINDLGIYGAKYNYFVNSYVESLLLLNR